MPVKYVIIEDTDHDFQNIKELLDESPFRKKLVDNGRASDVRSAIDLINKKKPQFIFLDIELKGRSAGGFDVIKSFDSLPFHVIFTTSHEYFGTKAIQTASVKGVDFLIKPIGREDLNNALEKYFNFASEEKGIDLIKAIPNIQGMVEGMNQIVLPEVGSRGTSLITIKYKDIIKIRNCLGLLDLS